MAVLGVFVGVQRPHERDSHLARGRAAPRPTRRRSSTASHAGPDRRARTDVRMRKGDRGGIRQPRQHLVAGGSRRRAGRRRRSRAPRHADRSGGAAQRQRREVQRGRPAPVWAQQRGEVAAGSRSTPAIERASPAASAARHRELLRSQLRQRPLRAHAPERKLGLAAGAEDQLGTGLQVLGDRRQHRERLAGVQVVSVVKHEHELGVVAIQVPSEPIQARSPRTSRAPAPAHRRLGACRPSDRRAQRHAEPNQAHRVIVGLLDRDPSEGPLVLLGPLRQDRRLSVAGRRNERRNRRLAGFRSGIARAARDGPCPNAPAAGDSLTPGPRCWRSSRTAGSWVVGARLTTPHDSQRSAWCPRYARGRSGP